MRELKKAIWICYIIQAALIILFVLILVLNKILSSQGIVPIPLSPWIIPIVFPMNYVLCIILFITAFSRTLRKTDPDLYDDLIGQSPLSFISYRGWGFAFKGDCGNEAVNKLRTYARSYYLLIFIIFMEVVFASLILN